MKTVTKVNRRNFLKIGAFGAGLSLAGMLQARARAGSGSSSKAAIMIYLPGGPSHEVVSQCRGFSAFKTALNVGCSSVPDPQREGPCPTEC